MAAVLFMAVSGFRLSLLGGPSIGGASCGLLRCTMRRDSPTGAANLGVMSVRGYTVRDASVRTAIPRRYLSLHNGVCGSLDGHPASTAGGIVTAFSTALPISYFRHTQNRGFLLRVTVCTQMSKLSCLVVFVLLLAGMGGTMVLSAHDQITEKEKRGGHHGLLLSGRPSTVALLTVCLWMEAFW